MFFFTFVEYLCLKAKRVAKSVGQRLQNDTRGVAIQHLACVIRKTPKSR